MHRSDAELQALIDGELGDEASERVLAHLASCGTCKARHEEMALSWRDAADRLARLDPGRATVSADDVIRSAERRTIAPRAGPRTGLWAAAIAGLLVAGAVAAAVFPGSPLRTVLERALTEAGESGPVEPVPAGDAGLRAGVALVAGDGLEIVFEATQAEGTIELTETGSDTLRVETSSGSVGFAVGGGSVRVDNEGAGASYRISIPAGLPTFAIRVSDRTVYRRLESEVLTDEFIDEGGVRRLEFPVTRAPGP